MFCFELSWLSYLFGNPVDAKGMIDKKLDDPDITADDVYSAVVKFGKKETRFMVSKDADIEVKKGFIKVNSLEEIKPVQLIANTITGTILIDIVSRPAIRELRIVGEKGTLKWNWNDSFISIETADGAKVTHGYDKGNAAEGYNANICEQMYENELANWIAAIQGKEKYLYSKEEEEACIKMLKKVEGRE